MRVWGPCLLDAVRQELPSRVLSSGLFPSEKLIEFPVSSLARSPINLLQKAGTPFIPLTLLTDFSGTLPLEKSPIYVIKPEVYSLYFWYQINT